MKKSIKLVLGGLTMAFGVATCTGGVSFCASATPDATRSYWRVGPKSSLEFTDAVLAEKIDEKYGKPLSLRTRAIGPGEKFICDVRVAHPAPNDEIVMAVFSDSGVEVTSKTFTVEEDNAGFDLWLTYAGTVNRAGRYTCRFSHGEQIREIPFEIAADGA